MLAYPGTQARAQAELDAVVGRARLPTFAGYPLLPYTRAMVKEVLRWKPPPPDTKDEGHVSYGFGRRQCPGRHAANNSLFIEIVIMLWAMKIELKKDASGQLPLDVDGFVDRHDIVVLADSSHTLKLTRTCVVRQTICPLRMRDLYALPRSSRTSCPGT